ASRTVGYYRSKEKNVGIEGSFNPQLAGKSGVEKMFRVDPRQNIWLPTQNLTSVEPTVGADVHTTLDVNMQDIAENALYRGVKIHQPDWGTAIVMDVETGAIRAMANLGVTNDGKAYYEMYNYAIANATEPGSTFKLATMMALLEDGHVTLDSEVDIENGKHTFYDECDMTDSNVESAKWDTISVQKAFEQSSNVGMAKLVDQHYKYSEFTNSLRRFHLDKALDLDIEGEPTPTMKDTTDGTWSLCTNPWMAIGYETRLTPLQMLTLFNAVANNGKMMKPYLVEEVVREGEVIETYKPTIIDEKIASRKTIEQMQILLEGVVERGTAKKLKTSRYRFAGKTGTSQQNYGKRRRKKEYQASFAGYFPADNPRYSCIVVIFNPRGNSYYGGDVAGPIFREIADMAYNSMIDIHEPLNQGPRPVLYSRQLPRNDAGVTEDIATIFNHLNINTDSLPGTEMVMVRGQNESVVIEGIRPQDQKRPNVRGMRLRDAIYVLENHGYKVHPRGVGRVVGMEWHKDARGRPGQDVTLTLR
ncbi:MAG: penicillin-binding transpeptidase domain-containing protein, partial [Bacteroidota bacterium]